MYTFIIAFGLLKIWQSIKNTLRHGKCCCIGTIDQSRRYKKVMENHEIHFKISNNHNKLFLKTSKKITVHTYLLFFKKQIHFFFQRNLKLSLMWQGCHDKVSRCRVSGPFDLTWCAAKRQQSRAPHRKLLIKDYGVLKVMKSKIC